MNSERRAFDLSEVGRIVTGKTPLGARPEFFDGLVPFVTPPDFAGQKWVTETARTISELGAQSVRGCVIPPKSVMVTCIGSDMGKAAIASARCVTNQQINAVVVDETKFSPEFLFYNLALRKAEIRGIAGGSAQPILNKSAFGRIQVRLPSLKEQRRVVDILHPLDDRIALLRETNATLEAIAQALFKSWFVDFDPVRAKSQGLPPAGMDEATAALFPDGFEESAQGELPRGWQVSPVGQVVEGIYDGPHATPPEAGAGPVFLGIKNLTGSALDLSEVRHIAEGDFAQWTRRVLPQAGDIVFSYEATLGFFALIPPGLRCCLGRRLALIRPRTGAADGHFLFHQFIAAPFQQLLQRHTIHGATVNRIALKQFPSYPVLNPPAEVKAAFGSVVAPLWARIHENQAQAQTLATLRDTLLPRLISGQLRLPEAEQAIEESSA